MDKPFIGVLPAAGRGSRLAPMRYPKELLPMGYEPHADGGLRARAVAEYAMEAITLAEVRRVLLVVAPWKLDLITYLGDGRDLSADIAYLLQEEARGLPYALDLARPWCRGGHTVFALPDTIFEPRDTLRVLRARYLEQAADLALAVFPTDQAHRLGPVVLSGGRVERVLDKPADPPAANTWGAAIWGDAFTELLHDSLPVLGEAPGEPVLGDIFDLAVHTGLKVIAEVFPAGSFDDAGSHAGLFSCLTRPAMTGPDTLSRP